MFSIESQIIPKLEKLFNEASSDTIWKTRIDTAVEDWVRTLEWSSPDFNPEPSERMNEVRTSVLEDQESSTKDRFNEIATSFDSHESVFSKLTMPKIAEEFDFVDFEDDGDGSLSGTGKDKARDLYKG